MIWVLTEEYNDYNQHGEYFIHAWDHKPSNSELWSQGVAQDRTRHVQNGGGRENTEDHWYILEELK